MRYIKFKYLKHKNRPNIYYMTLTNNYDDDGDLYCIDNNKNKTFINKNDIIPLYSGRDFNTAINIFANININYNKNTCGCRK